MKRAFGISLLCLIIGGCYSINRDNLNKLEIGMNREQVREIMGKPHVREADQNQEWWLYQIYADSIYTSASEELTPVVFDTEGKLIGWGRNFWTSKEQKYDVKIDQRIKQE